MFDPSLVKTGVEGFNEPEPKRHLGHTKAAFGAKSKKKGYFLGGEAVNQHPPNRRFRRLQLALAPRPIRVLAKRNRETYKFAHQPWGAWNYLPAEERKRLLKLDYDNEERKDAIRQIRNMLKQRKHGFTRKDA